MPSPNARLRQCGVHVCGAQRKSAAALCTPGVPTAPRPRHPCTTQMPRTTTQQARPR
ncbi:hypothetical protein CBM2633_B10187 [Cupriavidus taiwanensis]|nr:hypothetical protein CBM2633_B10187 [Cupriavidus taiwanensis]